MTIWHVTTTFSLPLLNQSCLTHCGLSSGSPSPYSSTLSFLTVPSAESSSKPAAISLTAFPPRVLRSLPNFRCTCCSISAASLLPEWSLSNDSKSSSHLSQMEKAKKACALLYKAFSLVRSLSKILSVSSLTLFHSWRCTKSWARLFLSTQRRSTASGVNFPNARSISMPPCQFSRAWSKSPLLNASLPAIFTVASTRPTQKAS
mmetsp:Transcript_137947/g.440549  ORF Transcript_137947/g.440549 Transcript_137947/m.440549 type:complete len:204 (-) Transcript_137947:616-1227(-)